MPDGCVESLALGAPQELQTMHFEVLLQQLSADHAQACAQVNAKLGSISAQLDDLMRLTCNNSRGTRSSLPLERRDAKAGFEDVKRRLKPLLVECSFSQGFEASSNHGKPIMMLPLPPTNTEEAVTALPEAKFGPKDVGAERVFSPKAKAAQLSPDVVFSESESSTVQFSTPDASPKASVPRKHRDRHWPPSSTIFGNGEAEDTGPSAPTSRATSFATSGGCQDVTEASPLPCSLFRKGRSRTGSLGGAGGRGRRVSGGPGHFAQSGAPSPTGGGRRVSGGPGHLAQAGSRSFSSKDVSKFKARTPRHVVQEGREFGSEGEPSLTKARTSRLTKLMSVESGILDVTTLFGDDESMVQQGFKCGGTLLSRIWSITQSDTSFSGRCYGRAADLLILVSILFSMLIAAGIQDRGIEVGLLILDTLFFIDTTLRIVACPNKWAFIRRWFNILDMVSTFAAMVASLGVELRLFPWGPDSVAFFVLVCVTPCARFLRLSGRMDQCYLIAEGLSRIVDALQLTMFILVVIVLFFAACIYVAEPRSNIANLPQALWLTVVSLTTVGYGDMTPETPAGYILVSTMVIFSVLYMAVPLGIIGNEFTQVWKERDRILFSWHTQNKFKSKGYDAFHLVDLFAAFSEERPGMLTLGEFLAMISQMKVGLDEQRTLEVFETIDRDGSGQISYLELVRAIFPDQYSNVLNEWAQEFGSEAVGALQ